LRLLNHLKDINHELAKKQWLALSMWWESLWDDDDDDHHGGTPIRRAGASVLIMNSGGMGL
jgi:hypothetical protein